VELGGLHEHSNLVEVAMQIEVDDVEPVGSLFPLIAARVGLA
jgi:hypothetical protein